MLLQKKENPKIKEYLRKYTLRTALHYEFENVTVSDQDMQ
jgi:hypothetical protein